ncbi:sulfite transporter TauE/SafE [Prauserella sp. PE36]|uniref:Probable membrane transporter protein n=1 Tax=Prauserella endophytica TaxID=1592324 RepID=A0ABY2S819_9PSEU|nr:MULTISPECIES: sulfite exporter TauE/SafE family protein [Prauserella]PXY30168.1 sulfite transporter TauE/SafE [Prauserella coralliicola]RBM22624.1 sulfite transporter TauE/SafE [Prauserella sp. PE36]TKG71235.1 sulfite exporter TauE/SafE family protein [Prauserella endophytica]
MPEVLVGLVVLAGALVQGAVGYGMNLVAVPLVALIDPRFLPVPLLLIASAHGLLALAREHGDTDWSGVGWAMLGRVPGTALGVLAVATLAERPFSAVVGAAVLACVVLSVLSWRPRPTRGPLLVAGVASGAFSTAASIGGPPIALLYQHSPGPTIRATLAATFGLGTLLSLVGLGLGGQVHVTHFAFAAWLLPFLLAGFLLSGPARRFLDGGRMRVAVLVIAGGSALALLVRAAVG